jgi:hypothetical protein
MADPVRLLVSAQLGMGPGLLQPHRSVQLPWEGEHGMESYDCVRFVAAVFSQ